VNLDDTIVAIATPPGHGGIGVVRLAGPEARKIALPMLRLKHDLEPGRAIFGELIEPGDEQVETAAPGSPATRSHVGPDAPVRAGEGSSPELPSFARPGR